MDYIQDKIRKDIADEIKYLDLPTDWKPYEVIRYIVRIIEKGKI
jgi:hypothetical protein